jgi:hypothetical protein
MTIANYAELVTEIESYLDDTVTLSARIPTFIKLNEAQINRRLQDAKMEARLTFAASGAYTSLPADFGGIIGVTTGDGELTQVSSAEITAFNQSRAGTPNHYAIVGDTITFAPANNTASVTMLYCKRVPDLTSGAPTNWLLTVAPDVYLFGCLYQASVYTVDDERAASFNALFSNALEELIVDSERRKWGAAPVRPRIKRS